MSPEQEQLMNKLEGKLEALEQHGMSLEDALQRMQEQERASAGPPDLVKDIWPAQRVLNDALEAARASNAEETLTALNRLVALNSAVAGDLPAAEIIIHCERALAYLSQNALDEAGVEMGMAYRVADGTKFATLVPPNVISLIQTQARSNIQAGKPRAAMDVVRTILTSCAEHESLDRMERIDSAIAGARAAIDRGAWPVVEAELFEAHKELTDLAETIRPERWNLTRDTVDEGVRTIAPEAGEAVEEEAAESPEAPRAEETAAPAEADEAPETDEAATDDEAADADAPTGPPAQPRRGDR
jgi:hypothetical protein